MDHISVRPGLWARYPAGLRILAKARAWKILKFPRQNDRKMQIVQFQNFQFSLQNQQSEETLFKLLIV